MITKSLNGKWNLRRAGDRRRLNARVPGDVYADLLAAGQIPDPFYRDNEDRLQWIGETDWEYSRTFDADKDLLEQECIRLQCRGLDTLATVFLNGKKLACTDNMFRTWEWDVKNRLKPKGNSIRIVFSSTIAYIKQRESERRLPGWGAPKKEYAAPHGWVRKQQCNFGWDWGIKAVTCGIWRDIALLGFSGGRLRDTRVRQHHRQAGSVKLDIETSAEVFSREDLYVHAEVALRGSPRASGRAVLRRGRAVVSCVVAQPELWWPNNMGAQPLYTVTVTLRSAGGSRIDRWIRRVGLRELRLERRPDRWGESFGFKVNGKRFFAKGANWIPNDAVQARMTARRYSERVTAAAAANMNMLRVWGGGLYEDDAFYDACDDAGICVWQDFMFACSTYPTFDKSFMATVKQEARDNIRRLRHHACLALWCGNNELEQGLVGDEGWEHWKMPWNTYLPLFDKILPDMVGELDPDRDYWPCSPHSPRGDRRDHSNPECGDAHLWQVWHKKEPFEWYRGSTHRFVSEFGFQSFPEPRTVNGYTVQSDRNITSYIMEYHQRCNAGNINIMQYMLDWFRLPEGFDNILWTSQILHGVAMQYGCEHWRRSMPRCMGALIWQLNDTWPVASGSAIDFHGRWKALHYMTRRFFAPLMISGVEDAGRQTVALHVVNDLCNPVTAVARWTVTDLQGAELDSGSMRIRIAAQSSRRVRTLRMGGLLRAYGERNILVWLNLLAANQPESTNLAHFVRPKHMELNRRPGLRASVAKVAPGVFRVSLKTRKPVLWVWLNMGSNEAAYTDNFFHLRPGQAREIDVTMKKDLSLKLFREQLQCRSLVDTY